MTFAQQWPGNDPARPEPVAEIGIYCLETGQRFEDLTMSSYSFRTSRPDGWIQPRPHQDATLRFMKHGPIQPMEEPGFFARLFGRH